MTKDMPIPQRLRALTITLAIGWSVALPSAASTWDDAQDAFANYNDTSGLKLLEQAAEEGDLRAMQAWGLALLHGQRLFPTLLKAQPSQAAVWFDRVSRHCADAGTRATEAACAHKVFAQLARRCPAHMAWTATPCPAALVRR
jgi:hypothetical protein